MKASIVALLMVLMCKTSFLSASLPKDHNITYYYSTVEFVETPLSHIKGSIPLSREEAMKRNHYRFVYDNEHRLISISFYNGDHPRAPNHTANLFTLAHRMEFDYERKQERITFFDVKGQQVEVLGNCREFVYAQNSFGFRESLFFLDGKGQRVENAWGIYEYRWSYQHDGSVIEDRFDREGKDVAIRPGFEFYRLRLYFNIQGHIALMQNIDGEGNLKENASGASQDRITTNVNGNFLKWEVLDNNSLLEKGNGPDVAMGIQEFNPYGYEVSLEHRDESGNPMFSAYGICKSRTTFDAFGNILERTFFDGNDRPAPHGSAGYHKLRIGWDPTGNRRESLSYFDESNHPIVHRTRGYHAVIYGYDEHFNLVRLEYRDGMGRLVNRLDNGTAYMTYHYDSMGNPLESRSFDREGKPVNQGK